MTSTDQFEVQPHSADRAARAGASGSTVGDVAVDVPRHRLGRRSRRNELNNIFQPSRRRDAVRSSASSTTTGRSQYLATCAGDDPTGSWAPEWHFSRTSTSTRARPCSRRRQTQTVGGINGFASGDLRVNPVQIVRWELMTAAARAGPVQRLAARQAAARADDDRTRRSTTWSAATSTRSPAPVPGTTRAHRRVRGRPAVSPSRSTPELSALQPKPVTFLSTTRSNADWAPDVIEPAAARRCKDPQRIRSVRAASRRRARRRPTASLNVTVPNADGPFIYRYCLLPAAAIRSTPPAPCSTRGREP